MKRTPRTKKISVSLPDESLAALRKHAKRKYDGNLSAAIAALARQARYEDGADALMEWIGDVPAAELAAVEAELRAPVPPVPARRRRKAA